LTDKRPDSPPDRHATTRKAREARLAAALRANLKRRKAATRSEPATAPGAVAHPPKDE